MRLLRNFAKLAFEILYQFKSTAILFVTVVLGVTVVRWYSGQPVYPVGGLAIGFSGIALSVLLFASVGLWACLRKQGLSLSDYEMLTEHDLRGLHDCVKDLHKW
jgi:hypothetical protein